ncbi:MAG: GTPase HflX [Armatimonadota bacterium]|nr:MAG: GTPase HflX [Armatimonadota bacterium]
MRAQRLPEAARPEPQRAMLAALEMPGRDWEESLAELALLAESAGAEVVGAITQRRDTPDPATFLGKGKAEEVRDEAAGERADIVVVDDELRPVQQRNLEQIIRLPVLDRTAIILDIFARRARSNEGKIQVELAQYTYLLPRLTGRGTMLSRLGGGRGVASGAGAGIGARGPGETKLEMDRRRIRRRITALRKQVRRISQQRRGQRRARSESLLPVGAIVGYTNAGKSTLLNALSGADIYADDRLFATLDPTVRRVECDGMTVLLADTVGFIRNLPHQLIAAFHATLEEVVEAHFLIHVVDAASEMIEEHHAAVLRTLAELGAVDRDRLVVLNKADLVADRTMLENIARRYDPAVIISATTGEGLGDLRTALADLARRQMLEVEALLPHDRGDLLALAYDHGEVRSVEHRPEGVMVSARVPPDVAARLEDHATEPETPPDHGEAEWFADNEEQE